MKEGTFAEVEFWENEKKKKFSPGKEGKTN